MLKFPHWGLEVDVILRILNHERDETQGAYCKLLCECERVLCEEVSGGDGEEHDSAEPCEEHCIWFVNIFSGVAHGPVWSEECVVVDGQSDAVGAEVDSVDEVTVAKSRSKTPPPLSLTRFCGTFFAWLGRAGWSACAEATRARARKERPIGLMTSTE